MNCPKHIRWLLALSVATTLSVDASACGEHASGPGAASAAHHSSAKRDRDNDRDHNDDDAHDLLYGHAASGSDLHQLTGLVRRYYAASASGNGRIACSLMASFIAESVVETAGRGPGLHGHNCPTVMSKLFAQHHKVLAAENATFKMLAVRVRGSSALTIMSFSALPEVRQLQERRIHGTWRLLRLLDGIIE